MSGVPVLYVFSEDDGSRESCSIFYSRYLLVEIPDGGRPQIEAALDQILVRSPRHLFPGSPLEMLPDHSDPSVQAMIGVGGDMEVLVAHLASRGIAAHHLRPETVVESE